MPRILARQHWRGLYIPGFGAIRYQNEPRLPFHRARQRGHMTAGIFRESRVRTASEAGFAQVCASRSEAFGREIVRVQSSALRVACRLGVGGEDGRIWKVRDVCNVGGIHASANDRAAAVHTSPGAHASELLFDSVPYSRHASSSSRKNPVRSNCIDLPATKLVHAISDPGKWSTGLLTSDEACEFSVWGRALQTQQVTAPQQRRKILRWLREFPGRRTNRAGL